MTLKEQLFEAGKLDGTYWNRAILDGRPYTTDALLKLHSNREITQSTIDSAADKAKEYLFADEIDAWRTYVSLLIGRAPKSNEQVAYLLGLVYSMIDGGFWRNYSQGGKS